MEKRYIITDSDGVYKIERWPAGKDLPQNAVYSAADADEILEVFIDDFQRDNLESF